MFSRPECEALMFNAPSSPIRCKPPMQTGRNRAPTAGKRHCSQFAVELFATLGLALSTLVAVTAVSIGIARAEIPIMATSSPHFSFALLIGLLLIGIGSTVALVSRRH
jgi:hypothetical protein